jgi:protein ImuB
LALPVPGEVPAPALPVPAPAAQVSTRRFLALHLPLLPVEATGPTGDAPVLVWRTEGAARRVVALDPRAAALGLRPGQALADAQAILPGVQPRPEDPAAEAARLQALGLWALRFSPLVALDPPQGLLLDITGVPALFGGEAALRDRALAGLARHGHAALAAVAGTTVLAAALARADPGRILPPGEEAGGLAPLPLAALPLAQDTLRGLRRLGLERAAELLAQPRAPLARRFGRELVLLLDRALGTSTAPFHSLRPPPEFHAAREMLEPLITRAGIDAVLQRQLLPELCAQLATAGRGLRRLALRAFRAEGGMQEIGLGLGLPGRDPAHLAKLLENKLDALEPRFGFDRIELLAEWTEPLGALQAGLAGAGRAEQQAGLSQLLDRLGQRLAVWRLAPRASHWPERAVMRADPFLPVETPEGWAARPRPVLLMKRPELLQVLALMPDEPPRRLLWRGAWHEVIAAEGPERFEPEWWRDRPDRPVRDYYRVECADGTRLWVCRAGLVDGDVPPRWFLHGAFP